MNSDIISRIETIALDDLQEEYISLYWTHQKCLKIHDDDLQQIHELKQNLKISKAAEEHLAQELEIVSGSQNVESEKCNKKLHQELEELKSKLTDSEEYNDSLERKIDLMNGENKKLQEQLHEISATIAKPDKTDDFFEKCQKLEGENLEFLAKLNENQEIVNKSYMVIAEKETQIEVLKEEIQCYEENLNAKRVEIEEKSSMIESLQEKIIELSAELASLKTQPDNENRKGNSLFAEVDDQRQVMKSQLLAQKKCFLEMKKTYRESQYEIRRLKRENTAIQSEIQACSAIFLNSKKFYEEKLVQKISNLCKQNADLENKLKLSQTQLLSLAEKNEITWLESMMMFCKNETKELTAQLQSIRLQKGIIEKNYRDSQQELAKWRFEALKSRCIIIDRESLLDENAIGYKKLNDYDVKLTDEEVTQSSPIILLTKSNIEQQITGECFPKEIEKIVTEKSENVIVANVNPKDCLFSHQQEVTEQKTMNDSKGDQYFGSIDKNIKTNEMQLTEDFTSNINFTKSEKHSSILKEDPKLSSFQIYEDVTNTCSLSNKKSEQLSVDTINVNKENKENTANFINKPYIKSSLASCRNPFEKDNKRAVKFDSQMESKNRHNDNITMKVVTKKTKSNITIKKIIIKSKEDIN